MLPLQSTQSNSPIILWDIYDKLNFSKIQTNAKNEIKFCESMVKPLFVIKALIRVFKGGRASGKTRNVCIWYLLMLMINPRWNAIGFRLFQKDGEALKQKFLAILHDVKTEDGILLKEYFDVQQEKIICKDTGNFILFKGCNLDNVDEIKGYDEFNAYLIDESEDVPEEFFDVLIPTARGMNATIDILYNPKHTYSYVNKTYACISNETQYQKAQEWKTRESFNYDYFCYTHTQNYPDNEYLPEQTKMLIYEDAIKHGITSKKFRHIWLGELLDDNNLYPFLGKYEIVDNIKSELYMKYGKWYYRKEQIKFKYRIDVGGTDDYAFLTGFEYIEKYFVGDMVVPKLTFIVLEERRIERASDADITAIHKTLSSLIGINKHSSDIKFDTNSINTRNSLNKIFGWRQLGTDRGKVSKKKTNNVNFKESMVRYATQTLDNLIIDSSCKKLLEELPMFKRLEKDGNIISMKFVDGNDHSVDAMLYFFDDVVQQEKTITIKQPLTQQQVIVNKQRFTNLIKKCSANSFKRY